MKISFKLFIIIFASFLSLKAAESRKSYTQQDLYTAIRHSNVVNFRIFLDILKEPTKIDINYKYSSYDNCTPLILAAKIYLYHKKNHSSDEVDRSKAKKIVRFLYVRGADLDAKDDYNKSFLDIAKSDTDLSKMVKDYAEARNTYLKLQKDLKDKLIEHGKFVYKLPGAYEQIKDLIDILREHGISLVKVEVLNYTPDFR